MIDLDLTGPNSATDLHELAFEAFGVHVAVAASSPELLERVRAILPPGWRPGPADTPEQRFELTVAELGNYSVAYAGNVIASGLDLDLALGVLDAQLRLHLGIKAPRFVFVHAGVVGFRDRAVLIPGRSFSGKTTLVAALVRHGAAYYSDEFAVIDEDGRVHPYARPLAVRTGGRRQTDQPVSELGGATGEAALPIGAVVVTSYRVGADWTPTRMSPGEGAIALLANAVSAREQPARVMPAISKAVKEAVVFEGERGEAELAAPAILAELEPLFD